MDGVKRGHDVSLCETGGCRREGWTEADDWLWQLLNGRASGAVIDFH